MTIFEAFLAGMMVILMIIIAIPKLIGTIYSPMRNFCEKEKEMVINNGAVMFYNGDHIGCFNLYKSYLMKMRVDISWIDQCTTVEQMCWGLRKMIDPTSSTGMWIDTSKTMKS